MRVWIDLANTPQVRFFQPIEARLREDGHEILITARDHRETATLAQEAWRGVEVDGTSSPDSPLLKGLSLLIRTRRLAARARVFAPDVALSHNSYAQVLAARALGVPTVTAMDYEHQPANHLAFRLASRIVVPEVFPDQALRRFGARPDRVRRYRGLKEEMYLMPTRLSDAERARLGLLPGRPFAVLRLPPDGALYHQSGNELIDAAAAALRRKGAAVIVLARSNEQRTAWHRRAAPDLVVPEPPVEAQGLMFECDAFVGAGGTMTREAALLGAPTYSIFAGELGAADRWLVERGRLVVLRDRSSLARLDLGGRRPPDDMTRSGGPLDTVVAAVEELRATAPSRHAGMG